MALMTTNAPWRARFSVAKFLRKTLAKRPTLRIPDDRLPDHIIKDIGLSPHQAELLRHQWPSETHRHPRL